jgi:acetyltransferase-like isoleucine patch superfamily enzyme
LRVFSPKQRLAANRRWHLLVNVIGASGLVTHEQRACVYRIAHLYLDTQDVRPGVFFSSADIEIGPGSMINRGCYFETPVRIGARCFLAMEVLIGVSTHDIGDKAQRAGPIRTLPVTVEDGCWIGARATILPGVTIGHGCVIAAGTVVADDCEPNGLYAGVPAVRKRDL